MIFRHDGAGRIIGRSPRHDSPATLRCRRSIACLSVLLLLPLSLAATPAGSQWRQGWGLTRPATPPPADDTPAGDAGALARLRLEGAAPRYQARVDNLLAGPLQVQLRDRQPGKATALPALPLRTVLPTGASRVLAHLHLATDGSRSGLDLVLDAVPGDPAARPRDHLYRLPFEGERIRVDQGFGGRFSHADAQNRHAVDFALPEGTPVLAARAGTVMQVQDGHADGSRERERAADRANLVRILHDDGSMAVYAHLLAGVPVRPGQRVEAGQRIGLSGNTGFSTAPHLHFAVQANTGLRLQSIPFRMTSPRGELRFPRDSDDDARAP
ncbi:M23 family metallopeptidase [Flavobacterium sp. MXW15]|uniref:M23 family metallopeptidase n=1 Tax=Xanthomonas chitinilytica TaxID=2989819 RepID=UPI0022359955|nr:M23 family metallopeptidase [Xanthomonas sp. H13-6]MCW4455002.1 M23 family metallopeptidase [Flavobacterium sp. MXW15]